jgi:hypothetical protein
LFDISEFTALAEKIDAPKCSAGLIATTNARGILSLVDVVKPDCVAELMRRTTFWAWERGATFYP